MANLDPSNILHLNPVNTNDSNSAKNPPAPTSRFSEGQKLAGCYGLKRRVPGEAEVWLAHDEVLGKDVSLHFLPSGVLGDSAAMNELRKEVKRTRQLIHPNILRVYDLVEDADWAAISMDAFDGESLAACLAKAGRAGLDVGDLQPWVAALCQTLEDAHKINVVHRDVSPGCVFLGGEGKVFVASFGISRVIADAVSRISGKPDPRLAACSPQQLEGTAVTRLDDVYAVGALLFEALTGELPFVGTDLAGQIRTAVPRAVSSVRRAGAAPVSSAWETTIAACLEKKPNARPQSAVEIAGRLLAVGAEKEPVAAAADAVQKKAVSAESSAAAVTAASVSEAGRSTPLAATRTRSEPPAAPAKQAVAATAGKSKFAPDVYPDLASERSRFPALGFAVAAGLVVIGMAGYYFNSQSQDAPGSNSSAALTAPDQPDGSELRSVNNRIETPATPSPRTADEPPEPAPVADPVAPPAPAKPEMLLAAAAPAAAPVPPPAPVSVPAPVASDEDKAVAEKAAALEKVRQAALAAEKAREEMTKKQQQADAAVAEAQKAVEQKTKAMSPVKRGAEEVLAQRKKLEDEQKAADLAAEQARLLAAEKARVADAAKKAIADLESRNKEKLAAQDRADAEIQALQKALADKQQSAVSVAKAVTDAEALRQQHLVMLKQSEQEVEQAKLAAAEVRRMREEAEAERRKLGQELAEMQKMMEKKKAEIEDRLKKLENPAGKPAAVAAPAPEPVKVPEPKPIEKPATPMPAEKPVSVSAPIPVAPAPATPAPVAVLPKPAVAAPLTPAVPVSPTPVAVESIPAAPAPTASEPAKPAMKTEPEKLAYIPPPAVPKVTVPGEGGENSLGMRFAPAGDVEFCIWQTRVKDFDAFARAVNLKSSAWRGPGFKQGPDHPVVNVTWVETVAFCKWLTDLEHKDGTLPATQFYRLPTDIEWSKAVGLPEESGRTPEARDMGVSDVYPWGNQWPPPPKAGNYTGEETGSDVAIKGYDDGFAWTSPVGSFPPNKLGLYDMGGNVWQWCMDAWNSDSKAKVLRGASWYNGALKLSLLSSCRVHASPDSSTDNYGFRIVRASESGKPTRK